MKRVLLVLTLLFLSVKVFCQNEQSFKFMRFYVPDNTGSPFPLSIDTYFCILDNGDTCIKISANNPYNAAELPNFGGYSIEKGSNLYLKLANGDVMTLPCMNEKYIKDGYVTTKSGVYQNYSCFSYFLLGTEDSSKLEKHNVVKVRGQFKFETLDGSLQFTPESDKPNTANEYIKAKSMATEKYNVSRSEKDRQEILKENPLFGF